MDGEKLRRGEDDVDGARGKSLEHAGAVLERGLAREHARRHAEAVEDAAQVVGLVAHKRTQGVDKHACLVVQQCAARGMHMEDERLATARGHDAQRGDAGIEVFKGARLGRQKLVLADEEPAQLVGHVFGGHGRKARPLGGAGVGLFELIGTCGVGLDADQHVDADGPAVDTARNVFDNGTVGRTAIDARRDCGGYEALEVAHAIPVGVDKGNCLGIVGVGRLTLEAQGVTGLQSRNNALPAVECDTDDLRVELRGVGEALELAFGNVLVGVFEKGLDEMYSGGVGGLGVTRVAQEHVLDVHLATHAILPSLNLGFKDNVDRLVALNEGLDVLGVEHDGLAGAARVVCKEGKVLALLTAPAAIRHRGAGDRKHRRLVALAKGLKHRKGGDVVDSDLGEVNHGRNTQTVFEVLGRQCREVFLHAVAEGVEVAGIKRDAHGTGMAAETYEQIRAAFDGLE